MSSMLLQQQSCLREGFASLPPFQLQSYFKIAWPTVQLKISEPAAVSNQARPQVGSRFRLCTTVSFLKGPYDKAQESLIQKMCGTNDAPLSPSLKIGALPEVTATWAQARAAYEAALSVKSVLLKRGYPTIIVGEHVEDLTRALAEAMHGSIFNIVEQALLNGPVEVQSKDFYEVVRSISSDTSIETFRKRPTCIILSQVVAQKTVYSDFQPVELNIEEESYELVRSIHDRISLGSFKIARCVILDPILSFELTDECVVESHVVEESLNNYPQCFPQQVSESFDWYDDVEETLFRPKSVIISDDYSAPIKDSPDFDWYEDVEETLFSLNKPESDAFNPEKISAVQTIPGINEDGEETPLNMGLDASSSLETDVYAVEEIGRDDIMGGSYAQASHASEEQHKRHASSSQEDEPVFNQYGTRVYRYQPFSDGHWIFVTEHQWPIRHMLWEEEKRWPFQRTPYSNTIWLKESEWPARFEINLQCEKDAYWHENSHLFCCRIKADLWFDGCAVNSAFEIPDGCCLPKPSLKAWSMRDQDTIVNGKYKFAGEPFRLKTNLACDRRRFIGVPEFDLGSLPRSAPFKPSRLSESLGVDDG